MTWHSQRTTALLELGRSKEALEFVEKARKRFPENRRLVLAEAAALRDLERVPEARALLQEVMHDEKAKVDDREEAARMLQALR